MLLYAGSLFLCARSLERLDTDTDLRGLDSWARAEYTIVSGKRQERRPCGGRKC